MIRNINGQSGQALLMVILTMMIALTIALIVFSDTLTNMSLKIAQENSEKALSAAEAGIEEILISNNNSSAFTIDTDDRSIDVSVTGKTVENYFQQYIEKNATAEVIVNTENNHTGYTLTIYWTRLGTEEQLACNVANNQSSAAIVIEKWADTNINQRLFYSGYRANGCGLGTNFISSSSGGAKYQSSISYAISSEDRILKITPVYTGATIRVEGQHLPNQQMEYISKATVQDSLESSAVKLIKGNPKLPEVFGYVLFSKNQIQ